MNKSAFFAPALLVLVGAGLPVAACSSNQNHAERDVAPEALGRPDYKSEDQAYLKTLCIGPEAGRQSVNGQPPACTPDPGSRPVNSAKAEEGAVFAWVWNLAVDAKARATYTYDDNTALFVVPDRKLAWEPPTDDIVPPPGFAYTKAVRFKGGPFQEYGGGFGQSFRTLSNTDASIVDTTGAPLPSSPEFPSPKNGAYDLRTWTGVAIWVRRGPLGMSTLRLGVTEKHSAEDLNSGAIKAYYEGQKDPADPAPAAPGIEENKYCRRWRFCDCSGQTPCSPLDVGNGVIRYYCFDPAAGTPSPLDIGLTYGIRSCGPTRCAENNTSTTTPDPLFSYIAPDGSVTGTCTLYQTSDGRSDGFCYDPKKDPPPPAKRERCNNPFSKPVTVTTDWQLIKVPFTELLQADEGDVADEFDLSSIKQIVVTHGGGWTDFYIANLGFYKKL